MWGHGHQAIRTNDDYQAALKEISVLMEVDPELGTPEGDRLDILATLLQAYEQRHFPMDLPDAVEAIKFRMDQQGLHLCLGGQTNKPTTTQCDIHACWARATQHTAPVRQFPGGISKARSLLGWLPPVSVDEGLRRAISSQYLA